MDILNNI